MSRVRKAAVGGVLVATAFTVAFGWRSFEDGVLFVAAIVGILLIFDALRPDR